MLPRDVYSQPDAPDPVLDDATVLGYARHHLASASTVTGLDESGGEARVYFIDEAHAFKTQRPHRLRPRTSLKKEVFFLEHLETEMPDLSVPRVLGYGQEADVEYVLMTRMSGVAARDTRLTGEPRRQVLLELGRSLRRLHSLDSAPLEAIGLFPGDYEGRWVRGRIIDGLREAAQAVSKQPGGWPLDVSANLVIDQAAHAVEAEPPRVALHSNPGPEHVYIEASSLTYRGLIDFGDAYISHPAFDLRRWTSPADRAALIAGYSDGGPVGEPLLRVWSTVMISGILATMVRFPERRDTLLDDLRALAAEL